MPTVWSLDCLHFRNTRDCVSIYQKPGKAKMMHRNGLALWVDSIKLISSLLTSQQRKNTRKRTTSNVRYYEERPYVNNKPFSRKVKTSFSSKSFSWAPNPRSVWFALLFDHSKYTETEKIRRRGENRSGCLCTRRLGNHSHTVGTGIVSIERPRKNWVSAALF